MVPLLDNVILDLYKIQYYELYYAKSHKKPWKHYKKWAAMFPDYQNITTQDSVTSDNFIREYDDQL